MNQMTPAEALKQELYEEKLPVQTISDQDYLKLEGLVAIAAQHNLALKTIDKAMAEITGEPDDGYGYHGVTSDAIFDPSRTSVTSLLDKLGIEVVSGEES